MMNKVKGFLWTAAVDVRNLLIGVLILFSIPLVAIVILDFVDLFIPSVDLMPGVVIADYVVGAVYLLFSMPGLADLLGMSTLEVMGTIAIATLFALVITKGRHL